jgi:2TM domain
MEVMVMTTPLTVMQYEEAERDVSRIEARRGLIIHAVITVLVWVILIPVNVFVAPEFPWSAFAVAGMAIGLGIHYLFAVRLLEHSIRAHQRDVESWAATKAA